MSSVFFILFQCGYIYSDSRLGFTAARESFHNLFTPQNSDLVAPTRSITGSLEKCVCRCVVSVI